MKTTFLKTLIIAGLLFSQISFAAVWETTKQWDMEEELKYSEWVKAEWHEKIFTDSDSRYFGIITDCADAAYTMRMIYAYENGLPFEIYSRRIKKRFSNQMTRFDSRQDEQLESLLINLSEENNRIAKENWEKFDDEKKTFFLFQRLISGLTSTWSLPQDTYSPKLGKENIRAGMLQLKRRFHTYTIKDIDKYGNLQNLNSTVPPEVRELYSTSGLQVTPEYIFEDGVLAFRWPEESKKASHLVKRNSTQQHRKYKEYKEKFDDYEALFQFKKLFREGNGDSISSLGDETEPYQDIMPRVYKEYCGYFKIRVDSVLSGVSYRNSVNRCLRENEYHAYSTPSRDKILMDKFIAVANNFKAAHESNEWQTVDEVTREAVEAILYASVSDGEFISEWKNSALLKYIQDNIPIDYRQDVSCVVEIDGNDLYLDTFSNKLVQGLISSNPNDSLLARWGFEIGESTCSRY